MWNENLLVPSKVWQSRDAGQIDECRAAGQVEKRVRKCELNRDHRVGQQKFEACRFRRVCKAERVPCRHGDWHVLYDRFIRNTTHFFYITVSCSSKLTEIWDDPISFCSEVSILFSTEMISCPASGMGNTNAKIFSTVIHGVEMSSFESFFVREFPFG